MKKYLASLLLALITTLSFGQNKLQDVVYSKDGSVIRGVIIENIPNKYINIKTPNGKVFVYQMYEIEKVAKEPYQLEIEETSENNGLQSGFRQTLEVGYLFDTGRDGIDGKKINIITSYQINPYFSIGIGTGLRYYPEVETTLIPVFGDLIVHFLDKKVSPYLELVLGYSYNTTNNWEKTGVLFNPIAGISFKVAEKASMNIGVGIEKQEINYYFGSYMTEAAGVSIKVGLSF